MRIRVQAEGLLDPEGGGITLLRSVDNYKSTRRHIPDDVNRCARLQFLVGLL
jgi:hypothetical protein